jgi:hypothetical protein
MMTLLLCLDDAVHCPHCQRPPLPPLPLMPLPIFSMDADRGEEDGQRNCPVAAGGPTTRVARWVPHVGAKDFVRCILNALEVHLSLMIREGKVRAVGTTDDAAMGYYVVKWTSEPYALQAAAEGVPGVIVAGVMMVDAVYFKMEHAVGVDDGCRGKTCAVEWAAAGGNQRHK